MDNESVFATWNKLWEFQKDNLNEVQKLVRRSSAEMEPKFQNFCLPTSASGQFYHFIAVFCTTKLCNTTYYTAELRREVLSTAEDWITIIHWYRPLLHFPSPRCSAGTVSGVMK